MLLLIILASGCFLTFRVLLAQLQSLFHPFAAPVKEPEESRYLKSLTHKLLLLLHILYVLHLDYSNSLFVLLFNLEFDFSLGFHILNNSLKIILIGLVSLCQLRIYLSGGELF